MYNRDPIPGVRKFKLETSQIRDIIAKAQLSNFS